MLGQKWPKGDDLTARESHSACVFSLLCCRHGNIYLHKIICHYSLLFDGAEVSHGPIFGILVIRLNGEKSRFSLPVKSVTGTGILRQQFRVGFGVQNAAG